MESEPEELNAHRDWMWSAFVDMFYHVIDQAVVLCFLGRHEPIAVGVLLDFLQRMAGVLEEDRVESFFNLAEFLGVDHDILGGPFHAGQRLVDHDSRVGKRVALSRGSGGQQHRAHRSTLPHAIGGHVATDELHGVIYGQSGGYGSTGGVQVEVYVRRAVLRLEKEQLGNNRIGTKKLSRKCV